MLPYEEFLAQKLLTAPSYGKDIDPSNLNPMLYPFQRAIVAWALHKGRAAIFARYGLGKTPMQLEWAKLIAEHTDSPVLIVAPLAVSYQTQREGTKFGIPVTICRSQSDIQPGVNITNYEMLQHFSPLGLGGIVLDESSILKSYDGKTRKALNDFAEGIVYRLCCTATPSPNDRIELINHAEFLGMMTGKEIIALYFTQDGNSTHNWRLKGHAKKDYWKWVASWAVACRKPSDLGYEDGAFNLPALHMHQLTVDAPPPEGMLFAVDNLDIKQRRAARRGSLEDRVAQAAALCNSNTDQWIVWCDLNDESKALSKAINGAVEVTGSDSPDHKARAVLDFIDGKIRVIVSKPTIYGFGLNLQNCHNTVFVGLSDSWEQIDQAKHRIYRFGQTEEVHCYVITSSNEGAVVANIERKERESNEMMDELIKEMGNQTLDRTGRQEMNYQETVVKEHDYTLYLGDSIKTVKNIPDESVHLSLFSPPFPGMYVYSNSVHDVGNCEDVDAMIEHFSYLVPELLRVLIPGRLVAVHLVQLTSMLNRDGEIGLKDYRGRVIDMFQKGGFAYAGEVTIDKNPQVQATRNKERGLLFKSLATDSSMMRMALADYLIYFRKPGKNPFPIRAGISTKYDNPNGWITEQEWVEWAAPVWYRHLDRDGQSAKDQPDYPDLHMYTYGISETAVLNVVQARETNDERHLCPLQLPVAERAIKLWSAPGETVYSPFAGIGSEGYEAIRLGRLFIGGELKESYWRSAIRNLERARTVKQQVSMFDLIPEEVAV